MKPIKLKSDYIRSSEWMRIKYKTVSTDGCYILKRLVYEDNKKKFDKLLKDCLITNIEYL